MNPICAYKEVQKTLANLLSTQMTSLSETFNADLREMVKEEGALFQKAYIEALPMYPPADGHKMISELDATDFVDDEGIPTLSADAIEKFKNLVDGTLIKFPLYSHQKKMLIESLKGKPCVVTTGTSSGKTESFLLPLLANLIKEASAWQPVAMNDVPGWQLNVENLRRRRTQDWHEQRPAAVRALILYPMNALVDDQLSRLRRTLDSDEAHEFYDAQLGGNRLTFGRYTGNTLGSGHLRKTDGQRDVGRISRVNDQLMAFSETSRTIARQLARTNGDEEKIKRLIETKSFFPRADYKSAEMLCRWEMQETPPDILITNYSMLSAMLMRASSLSENLSQYPEDNLSDGEVWDKTQRWLAEDPAKDTNPTRVFTIVVDELHLYRGTAGTEVAYLLRLLLRRLGLTPNSKQVRILASSASLEGNDYDPNEYLRNFFGNDGPYSVIKGDPVQAPADAEPITDEEKNNLTIEVVEAKKDFLLKSLPKPAPLDEFRQNLGFDNEQFVRLLEILEQSQSRDIPRYRIHWMIRNLPGVYAAARKSDPDDPNRTVSKLYFSNERLCDTDGNRLLEVMRCDSCGTLFLAGYKSMTGTPGKPFSLVGQSPKLEDLPNGYVEARITDEKEDVAGVFWPLPFGITPERDYLQYNGVAAEGGRAAVPNGCWKECYLDPQSGLINVVDEDGELCANWVHGYFYSSTNRLDQEGNPDVDAMAPICPHCGHERQSHGYLKSSIRQFRFGHDRYVQTLSQCLFKQLPQSVNPSPEGDPKRKLLAFSDSVDAASRLSDGIQTNHWRDVLRALMFSNGSFEINEEFIFELVHRFDEIGVCPFGPDIDDCSCWSNGANVWWTERRLDSFADLTQSRVLRDEIRKMLFGQGMIDCEWTGVGFVNVTEDSLQDCRRPNGMGLQLFREYCLGLIRLLGESVHRVRLVPNDILRDNWNRDNGFNLNRNGELPRNMAALRKPICRFTKKFSEQNHCEYLDLLMCGADALEDVGVSREFLSIDLTSLAVCVPSGEQHYYRCAKCRKIHLHNCGSVCTACGGSLEESRDTIQDLRAGNYFAQIALNPETIFRLHCEELTGQTEDQTLRQRLFRGLFRRDNRNDCVDIVETDPSSRTAVPRYDGIDLLSVTTTMEVGVDIGSLSTVILGNVPPERYNYQQRVGRAGRAGQRFSLAVTYSRGGTFSTDAFEHPEKMISSDPKMPFLCMDDNHIEIAARVIAKYFLREYFRNKGVSWTDLPARSDIHGEFGLKNGAPYDEDSFRQLLESKANDPIYEIIMCGTNFNEGLEEFRIKIGQRLIAAIPAALNNPAVSTDLAAQCLAESGVLPMFGMPSAAKDLYHRLDEVQQNGANAWGRVPEAHGSQRDFELALTYFAPGKIERKDHRAHWTCGLIGRAQLNYNGGLHWKFSSPFAGRCRMAFCPVCNRLNVFADGETIQSCKGCGAELGEVIDAIEPVAYMTDWAPKAASIERNGRNSRAYRFVTAERDNDCVLISHNGTNVRSLFLPQGSVYTVNNNGGRHFSLASVNLSEMARLQPQGIRNIPDNLNGQTLLDVNLYNEGLCANNEALNRRRNPNGVAQIPLLAPRVSMQYDLYTIRTTNTLRIDLASIARQGLRLNPTESELNVASEIRGARAGVRSAYYSAATMILKTAARMLDIPEGEIELVGIYGPVEPNGTIDVEKPGSIVFADKLINGSGFVYWLQNHLAEVLQRAFEDCSCTCAMSCEKCLRSYQNQSLHPLLDWRLGKDLIHLMIDQVGSYNCHLTDPGWLEQQRQENQSLAEGYAALDIEHAGEIVVAHPLWNPKTPANSVLAHEAGKRVLDTFNLKRRPAWLLQNFNQLQQVDIVENIQGVEDLPEGYIPFEEGDSIVPGGNYIVEGCPDPVTFYSDEEAVGRRILGKEES